MPIGSKIRCTGIRLKIATLCVLGVGFMAQVPAISASASSPQTWNAATDFGAHPSMNPAPDKYGNPGVWSWMSGTVNTPSTYKLLPDYNSKSQNKSACGVKTESWVSSTSSGDPAVFYNAGAKVEEGQDICAPGDVLGGHKLFMAPGSIPNGNVSVDGVIGWDSPITGMVTVSAKVQDINFGACSGGISWELDHGTTTLVGPTVGTGNAKQTFGPLSVSVIAGQSLYLEVGVASGANGECDDSLVKLKIVS